MSKFVSKIVTIEATQWFKNGDHPKDHPDGHPAYYEGKVVRCWRLPGEPADKVCIFCQKKSIEHGWIDTVQGGHMVCPGDWIITEPSGIGHYPCKPDVFALKYEPLVGG